MVAIEDCSHSPLLSSRPAFVTSNQYCIPFPPRTHTGKAPWTDGPFRMPKNHAPNLNGSLAAACLPSSSTTHRGANRLRRCKLCMPTLPPPATRRPLWPMGGRTWPLGCGRVAVLGRLQVRHLAKALLSVEQSPTALQSAAAPHGPWAAPASGPFCSCRAFRSGSWSNVFP